MSENQRRRIDVIQDADFTSDLETIDTMELRERRRVCSELDIELSYYRRLLHGRMDLLAFERRRRAGDEDRSLIEALPDILAAGLAAPPAGSQRQIPVDIPDLPDRGRRAVDHVLSDDFLTRLTTLEESDLDELERAVAEVEAELSRQRKLVFEIYEQVQHELTRRYREGLVDVGEVLRRG